MEQALSGVYLLVAEPVRDDRGDFARVFDETVLHSVGLETHVAQRAFATTTLAGTVRGLHFAAKPYTEAKIVTCLRGAIYDVIVDLREGSPSSGRWTSFVMTDTCFESLYIPEGFAHGYQTLRDDTRVLYDLSKPYEPAAATGIRYNDEQLAIPWPMAVNAISTRDARLPMFAEIS